MSRAIELAIEEEITARVNERMTRFLEVISKNYSIRYQRLLNDLASLDSSPVVQSTCCGTVKSGKRCQKPGKYDGYCKLHMGQKPEIRVTHSPQSSQVMEHTHSLPPLFKAGCPACECAKKNSSRVL